MLTGHNPRPAEASVLFSEGVCVMKGIDVGRHTSVDKMAGHAVAEGIDLSRRVIGCTGREHAGWSQRMRIRYALGNFRGLLQRTGGSLLQKQLVLPTSVFPRVAGLRSIRSPGASKVHR